MQFRTKIFIGSVVAALVSLVASETWVSRQVRERQQAALVSRLMADARLVAHFLEQASAGDDFDRQAREAGMAAGGRVTLVAADGLVVGDSTQSPEERAALDNHISRPEIVQARSGGTGQARRYSDTVRMDMLYVAVTSQHPVVRYVRLALPAVEVDAELGAMTRISLVALAVGVPLALLVAWVSTAPLARRVRDIAQLARAYRAGDVVEQPTDYGNDELGTVASTLGTVARELALRVSDLSQDRARTDAIVAGMVEGVLVMDADGRVQRLNEAARHMLDLTDASLGRPAEACIKDQAIAEQLAWAIRGEADAALELTLQRDPSRTVVTRAFAVPADRGGGAVLVMHDISDIRRVGRMRQDFVANVSHELRTPLTVIRGYAEALAEGQSDANDARECGEVIGRHAARMERLVADLLRLARLDAQQESLNLDRCDVSRLFDGIVRDLGPLVQARGHRITMHVAPDAETVLADAAKLHDVIRNLVDNAVTYAPDGAEIRLEAWRSDDMVRLAVADNGPGIPSEALPRIFERFYRVDPSRARPGGTGLGLAIVKHLVELHGGQVTAANSALGGAVFTVTLPVKPRAASGLPDA